MSAERCPHCGEPRPGRGTKEYGFHVCPPPEVPPSETRCDGTGGYESNGPEGWVSCEKCGKEHDWDEPTPPPALDGLDFEKASKAAHRHAEDGTLRYNPALFLESLQSQLREIVAAAVNKAREEEFVSWRRETDERVVALNEELSELRKLVREWQEGRKESYLTESLGTHSLKHVKAAKALAAFDLGPEGE